MTERKPSLSAEHFRGRHKARIFQESLGFTAQLKFGVNNTGSHVSGQLLMQCANDSTFVFKTCASRNSDGTITVFNTPVNTIYSAFQ